MGATMRHAIGHSAITYLVWWKGVQASEQLFCGLVGKRNLVEGNPLPRFFSSHPNNQKWAALFGHNISKVF